MDEIVDAIAVTLDAFEEHGEQITGSLGAWVASVRTQLEELQVELDRMTV